MEIVVLTIRDPVPEESGIIAELILESDCGTLPALFGSRVRQLLSWLYSLPGNPYSRSHVQAAADDSLPGVVGAAVGAPVSTTRAEELRTAGQLLRWYGPSVAARLPRLARAGRSFASLAPEDFYLAHIAVVPARRGAGAGALLLRAVEERAHSIGARRVVLDVDTHNERAQLFYAREGYRPDSAVGIDLGRHGAFTLRRFTRDL